MKIWTKWVYAIAFGAAIMLAIMAINAYLERGHKAAFHPDGPVSEKFRPGD